MSRMLREYRRTHDGRDFPLFALRDRLRELKDLDGDAVKRLSKELALPQATVRAAASYYADFAVPKGVTRICQGTSCLLAGSATLHEAVRLKTDCSPVYCLGFCDRSPTILRSDEGVAIRCNPNDLETILRGEPSVPPPPEIRCAAPEKIITRRIIDGDFSDLSRAREAGVYRALEVALGRSRKEIIDEVVSSGEKGRGGAAFPTGVKWRRCAEAKSSRRYVVANGDEGDPGSFIDRVLMEQDPHAILEGMAICAYAIDAREGIVFIRSEYPRAIEQMRKAIEEARSAGLLGRNILGRGFDFDVTIFPGMGSYVCGEETAMLNAIEGYRGEVRLRPPYPAESGLYGKPTVVDNVETLVNIPWIIERGAEAYRRLGTEACSGTKAVCLNHGFARPGIVEIEFGMTLRDVIEREAGGGSAGKRIEAVLLGGPMGSVLTPDEWDVPVCYSAMGKRGIQLGHAGIVAVHEGADYAALLLHWLRFMQNESCGKCVPCREGSKVAFETASADSGKDKEIILRRLFEVMEKGSLCAFGQLMPGPMRKLIDLFGESIFTGGPRP